MIFFVRCCGPTVGRAAEPKASRAAIRFTVRRDKTSLPALLWFLKTWQRYSSELVMRVHRACWDVHDSSLRVTSSTPTRLMHLQTKVVSGPDDYLITNCFHRSVPCWTDVVPSSGHGDPRRLTTVVSWQTPGNQLLVWTAISLFLWKNFPLFSEYNNTRKTQIKISLRIRTFYPLVCRRKTASSEQLSYS